MIQILMNLIPIAFHYIGEQVSQNTGLQIIPVQYNPKQILDTILQDPRSCRICSKENMQFLKTPMLIW